MRDAVDAGREQLGADQPVGLVGALPEQPLLDEHPEHVGDRLVERAGLVLVVQAGGVLGDAVGELVADDVDAAGERQEDDAVTVAEDHLGAVPEGVVVAGAVVHARDQRQALAVERVAAVGLLPQLPGGAEPVVGLGDRPGHRCRARPRSAPGCRAAWCRACASWMARCGPSAVPRASRRRGVGEPPGRSPAVRRLARRSASTSRVAWACAARCGSSEDASASRRYGGTIEHCARERTACAGSATRRCGGDWRRRPVARPACANPAPRHRHPRPVARTGIDHRRSTYRSDLLVDAGHVGLLSSGRSGA